MKLFKNVIEDAFEYNQAIAKLNSRGKPIELKEKSKKWLLDNNYDLEIY